tara:strand:+ start:210 stop:695 length:486 start_codon:yes stop_codon:yes gene_type:complete
MSDKMHYRDRVDVRFDDRFRFNRHREGAEKNGRENCVEHAGGEISILNHMCTSRSSSECVYYVTRARVSTIEERKENTLKSVSSFEEFSNSKSSFQNNTLCLLINTTDRRRRESERERVSCLAFLSYRLEDLPFALLMLLVAMMVVLESKRTRRRNPFFAR